MSISRQTDIICDGDTWSVVLKDHGRTQRFSCPSKDVALTFATMAGEPVRTPKSATRPASRSQPPLLQAVRVARFR